MGKNIFSEKVLSKNVDVVLAEDTVALSEELLKSRMEQIDTDMAFIADHTLSVEEQDSLDTLRTAITLQKSLVTNSWQNNSVTFRATWEASGDTKVEYNHVNSDLYGNSAYADLSVRRKFDGHEISYQVIKNTAGLLTQVLILTVQSEHENLSGVAFKISPEGAISATPMGDLALTTCDMRFHFSDINLEKLGSDGNYAAEIYNRFRTILFTELS